MMFENFRFVLVRPRNSGNVGSSLRAIVNFGFRDLAVVKMWNYDEEEAAMMAASTSPLLSNITFYESLDEALEDRTVVIGTSARRRGKHRRITMEDLRRLVEENRGEKFAILFGSEKTGLTSDELDRCDYYLKIDTDPEFNSLNLSQSVVIVAYEIRKALQTEPIVTPPRKISRNTINRILDYAEKISDLTDAPDTGRVNIIKALRGILGRSDVSEREGKIFLWFMRHVWWYLDNIKNQNR